MRYVGALIKKPNRTTKQSPSKEHTLTIESKSKLKLPNEDLTVIETDFTQSSARGSLYCGNLYGNLQG
jgi:hypothetical protein